MLFSCNVASDNASVCYYSTNTFEHFEILYNWKCIAFANHMLFSLNVASDNASLFYLFNSFLFYFVCSIFRALIRFIKCVNIQQMHFN